MAICKMPSERMNWLCEGTNLWALQTKEGLMLVSGKALVIRQDLADSLARRNPCVGQLIRTYGLREFIEGPHMHLVWDDGMRGLKL